ncbi:MAG TPA: hypothetical protein VEZ16_00190 [Microvirga sp.]|nr:hypothetical protein [Microvirga sp.]
MRRRFKRIGLKKNAALTVEQVLSARLEYIRGNRDFTALAKELGAHRWSVKRAAKGESYRTLPMPPGPMWTLL